MYSALDVSRVARFFVWLGVLKPMCCADNPLGPAADGLARTSKAKAAAAAAAAAAAKPCEPVGAAGKVEAEVAVAAVAVAADANPNATRLKELNDQINTAMKARYTGTIRELMAERAALQAEM